MSVRTQVYRIDRPRRRGSLRMAVVVGVVRAGTIGASTAADAAALAETTRAVNLYGADRDGARPLDGHQGP